MSTLDDADVADDAAATADRVLLSYPADLSTWGRDILDRSSYRAYLRKTLGRVEPGEISDEFVGVGCCGDTLDVPIRVEEVDGGTTVGPDTEIEYTVREACDVQGGWKVQSHDGPTE